MDIRNWSDKRKVLALLGMIFIVVGIVVTIFLVQRVQETRSRASESTTLALNPTTQNVAPGGEAKLDIDIDPGQNLVSAVKVTIRFDSTKFSVSEDSFEIDPASNLTIVEGPLVGDGTFAVSMSIGGADTTKYINTPRKIGVLTLTALSDAVGGETEVLFGTGDETIVNSLGEQDDPSENVLGNANPARIIIGGEAEVNECKPNISTCSWDPVEGATSYDYVITNVDEDKVFSEGNTQDTSIDFSSGVGITYKCEVVANNDCGGKGEAGVDSETCAAPSQSPTPEPSSTVTPTPTSVINTGTPTPTTVINTGTPTPTRIVSSTPTPTTPQGSTPTPTTPFTEVSTTPTLPPTGNPLVIGGIIGGILIVLGGLALFIL